MSYWMLYVRAASNINKRVLADDSQYQGHLVEQRKCTMHFYSENHR